MTRQARRAQIQIDVENFGASLANVIDIHIQSVINFVACTVHSAVQLFNTFNLVKYG